MLVKVKRVAGQFIIHGFIAGCRWLVQIERTILGSLLLACRIETELFKVDFIQLRGGFASWRYGCNRQVLVQLEIIEVQIEVIVRLLLRHRGWLFQLEVIQTEGVKIIACSGRGSRSTKTGRRHRRITRLCLLDLRKRTTYFAKLSLLPRESISIAQFGIDLHELQPQVATLRLVVQRVL